MAFRKRKAVTKSKVRTAGELVSSRGGRYGFVYRSRHDAYRALRGQGKSKTTSARISNEGKTAAGRSRMAKKAARTRKRRK